MGVMQNLRNGRVVHGGAGAMRTMSAAKERSIEPGLKRRFVPYSTQMAKRWTQRLRRSWNSHAHPAGHGSFVRSGTCGG